MSEASVRYYEYLAISNGDMSAVTDYVDEMKAETTKMFLQKEEIHSALNNAYDQLNAMGIAETDNIEYYMRKTLFKYGIKKGHNPKGE